MKVMVFGGSGFLGSYVVDNLISRGYEVSVFDSRPSRYLSNRGRMILGDLLDRDSVIDACQGMDYVYNFAGLADLNESINQPTKTISLNVIGNLNVLEACRKHTPKRFIYASSAYVFSKKGAFYGASKRCSEIIIEEYAEQFGLDHTIIRYGSVYGERADASNRIYRILKEALTDGKISFLGDGAEEREYIHGRDAGKLSVDVLDEAFKNKHVILTGIERFRYRDLLEMVNEIMGGKLDLQLQSKDYKGHYVQTPYSFAPTVGVKLTNNPCVDFGQGILECLETIYNELDLPEAINAS